MNHEPSFHLILTNLQHLGARHATIFFLIKDQDEPTSMHACLLLGFCLFCNRDRDSNAAQIKSFYFMNIGMLQLIFEIKATSSC